jgi:hypothetical protein
MDARGVGVVKNVNRYIKMITALISCLVKNDKCGRVMCIAVLTIKIGFLYSPDYADLYLNLLSRMS